MRSRLRLFALLMAGVTGACDDQVLLGSWRTAQAPLPPPTGGAVGSGGDSTGGTPQGGNVAAGGSTGGDSGGDAGADSLGGSSGGSPASGGSAGMAPETWKVADPGEGDRLCGTRGTPEEPNQGTAMLGVSTSYTEWTWPSELDSIESEFTLESEFVRDVYQWSHQFSFVGGDTGFLGLQVHGGYQAPDSAAVEKANMITFWVADTALAAEPDSRIRTAEGRDWLTIHVKYDFEACRTYRLRVALESLDADGDIWYGAWVFDGAEQTYVGRILVPSSWGRLKPMTSTWSNRIGHWQNRMIVGSLPPSFTRCNLPEPASMFFGVPSGNDGMVAPTDFVNSIDPEKCPTSRFTLFSNGVRQEIGLIPE
jgi:hypothetical protein